jgi:hypothetical protein
MAEYSEDSSKMARWKARALSPSPMVANIVDILEKMHARAWDSSRHKNTNISVLTRKAKRREKER